MTEKQIVQLPYPQNYPPYEDEINLIDYLLVIWKWKWVIVACTMICAVVAGVISLQMPKIYEISMVIEPGVAEVKADGSFRYIDSVTNINGKINEDIYNSKILKALHLDPLKVGFKFRSAIIDKVNLVTITSQWQEKDIDLGKKITSQLKLSLVDDYKKIVERSKGGLKNKVVAMQSELNQLEISRKQKQAGLKNIEQKKEGLLQARKNIEENMDKIIYQRDVLLKSKKNGNSQALLLYSTTIQRNLTYFNQISSELYSVKSSEDNLKAEVDKFPERIYRIKSQIDTLKLERDLINSVKIIREPKVSASPVKPKIKRIILLTGVVAFFFFLFLAFLIEYIKNATPSIK